MKIAFFNTLGSTAIIGASLFGLASSASADEVVGTIEISGANIEAIALGIFADLDGDGNPDTVNGNQIPVTTIDFGWFGDSNPSDPDQVAGLGEFFLNSADGVFAGFNPPPPQVGRVKDLPVGGSFGAVDNWLAFASSFGATPPVTDPTQFDTFFDFKTFTGITYEETANGINVNLDLVGTFETADGTKYKGEGIIGGEILFNDDFDDLESFLAYASVAGNSIGIDSWSGNFRAFKQVPESSNLIGLLGLGLVGTGMVASKRKLKN